MERNVAPGWQTSPLGNSDTESPGKTKNGREGLGPGPARLGQLQVASS
jgi:hypothetical protein